MIRAADAQIAKENKAYFKSPFQFLGVTKKEINDIARRTRKEIVVTPCNVLPILRGLWRSRVHEEMSLAIVLAAMCVDRLQGKRAWAMFNEWLTQSQTWDHVDELCIRVVGTLALSNPGLWIRIEEWASARNIWMQRASLISLLPAIRAGKAKTRQVERTCARLASEPSFYVRKAIGWVLREMSDQERSAMISIFRSIGGELSTLSRNEATRKLPATQRRELMLAEGGQNLPHRRELALQRVRCLR